MDTTQKVTAIEITGNNCKEVSDTVVREYSFALYLNGKELVTLLCLPEKLDYLVVGYLFTQGIINSRDDIIEMSVDLAGRQIGMSTSLIGTNLVKGTKTIGSSGAREIRNYSRVGNAIAPVRSTLKVSAIRIFELVDEFIHKSELFKDTGGVHSAAICSINGFVAYSDDIGRHNAVDKVIGECVLKDIERSDKFLLTSGRISSEILLKAARAGIPVAISKSAVTDGAIRYAAELGVTLAGFVRGGKMSVYANSERIMVE